MSRHIIKAKSRYRAGGHRMGGHRACGHRASGHRMGGHRAGGHRMGGHRECGHRASGFPLVLLHIFPVLLNNRFNNIIVNIYIHKYPQSTYDVCKLRTWKAPLVEPLPGYVQTSQ